MIIACELIQGYTFCEFSLPHKHSRYTFSGRIEGWLSGMGQPFSISENSPAFTQNTHGDKIWWMYGTGNRWRRRTHIQVRRLECKDSSFSANFLLPEALCKLGIDKDGMVMKTEILRYLQTKTNRMFKRTHLCTQKWDTKQTSVELELIVFSVESKHWISQMEFV